MTLAIIKDSTLEKVKDEIAKRNGYLKQFVENYAESTWDTLQMNVKAGNAPTLYPVGTELICGYNKDGTDYQFVWVVADNNREVTWEDGTKHPGLVLQSKFATVESIQFDHAEDYTVASSETTAQEGWYYWGLTGTTYTALNLSTGDTIPHSTYDSIHKCPINSLDVLRYGYNNYKQSAYRQWLNSAATRGNWWEAQHTNDVAPDQANTVDGFMHGLDADFLAVINPVKVQVATNTVTDGGVTDTMYDKFFLPSIEEMYGSPQAAGVEGAYFPYWKTKTGLNSPSNSANDGRKIYALESQSSAQYCRVRSAARGYSSNVWYVNTSGELNGYYAYSSFRCAPACVIS